MNIIIAYTYNIIYQNCIHQSFLCIDILSAPAFQVFHKHYDKLLPLALPVMILQMLYTEKVISKETLDEVNSLGSVLGDGPFKALCATMSEQPMKLKEFASVLLQCEQTIPIAKDILKEHGKECFLK